MHTFLRNFIVSRQYHIYRIDGCVVWFKASSQQPRKHINLYLGPTIETEPIELCEKFSALLGGICGVLSWTISKHSMSCNTTSLMSGLPAEVGNVHDRASSTNFLAEQLSIEPSNLGSTVFSMFPSEIKGLTQSTMWVFTSELLIMAGCPVISSSNIIPKL